MGNKIPNIKRLTRVLITAQMDRLNIKKPPKGILETTAICCPKCQQTNLDSWLFDTKSISSRGNLVAIPSANTVIAKLPLPLRLLLQLQLLALPLPLLLPLPLPLRLLLSPLLAATAKHNRKTSMVLSVDFTIIAPYLNHQKLNH